MDNKEYLDEFEQFLQEEVKQHRMYPSDHIWKNIRVQMHGYKAWPALTFISLFIITALTVSTLVSNHPASPYRLQSQGLAQNKQTGIKHSLQLSPSDITNSLYLQNNLIETAIPVIAFNEPVQQEMPVVRNNHNDLMAIPEKTYIKNKRLSKVINNEILELAYLHTANQTLPNTLETNGIPEENSEVAVSGVVTKAEPPIAESQTTADNYLKDFSFVPTPKKQPNSKYGFQFYITPSESYRILSDDKVKEVIQPAAAALSTMASASQNVPLTSNFTADVNDVVRHRPAMGIELGFAFLYNISNRIKFKTGVQLNVRQYYIETFQSRTSDLTSLSLINSRGVETISFYSVYNNNTGYKKAELDNKVYQLSIPLGIQWDMIQGKHFGVNAEASVQPTLTLTNNTYLLSTDYKHYTGGDEFFRRWNINTSMGINLTYHKGANSWQLGPQIRYQHLPTYSNLYPIKEFLMDYGIRLGYTHQLK